MSRKINKGVESRMNVLSKTGIRWLTKPSAEKMQQALTRYERKYGICEHLNAGVTICEGHPRIFWAIIRLPSVEQQPKREPETEEDTTLEEKPKPTADDIVPTAQENKDQKIVVSEVDIEVKVDEIANDAEAEIKKLLEGT